MKLKNMNWNCADGCKHQKTDQKKQLNSKHTYRFARVI